MLKGCAEVPLYSTKIHPLYKKKLVVFNNVPKKFIIEEICDIFYGPFLIMCFVNIKNIGDIYYPINWDNFYSKMNYILVENEPTREININLVFAIRIFYSKKKILILSFKGSKRINYINIIISTFLN